MKNVMSGKPTSETKMGVGKGLFYSTEMGGSITLKYTEDGIFLFREPCGNTG